MFLLLVLLKPYHVEDVVQALLADHNMLNDGIKKYIKQYKVDLNHRQSAWTRLQVERNLYVLTGLLYDWLEHLRVPVLSRDDLSYIVILGNHPEACLKKLDLVSYNFLLHFAGRYLTARHYIVNNKHLLTKNLEMHKCNTPIPIFTHPPLV